VQGLEPLRVLDGRAECPGDIGGDGVAAKRNAIGMDEMPVGEYRECGSAGAEIEAPVRVACSGRLGMATSRALIGVSTSPINCPPSAP